MDGNGGCRTRVASEEVEEAGGGSHDIPHGSCSHTHTHAAGGGGAQLAAIGLEPGTPGRYHLPLTGPRLAAIALAVTTADRGQSQHESLVIGSPLVAVGNGVCFKLKPIGV